MADASTSVWGQEPQLLRWQVRTWEHAALVPKSHGLSATVRDSKRILPEEITASIYAALAELESRILRWTEPLPPFDARLVRTVDGGDVRDQFIPDGSILANGRFSKVVPGWDEKVAAALGDTLPAVTRNIRTVAPLGIPQGDFSIQYGYRIDLSLISGRDADQRIETHQSLLMGCCPETLPPGISARYG